MQLSVFQSIIATRENISVMIKKLLISYEVTDSGVSSTVHNKVFNMTQASDTLFNEMNEIASPVQLICCKYVLLMAFKVLYTSVERVLDATYLKGLLYCDTYVDNR